MHKTGFGQKQYQHLVGYGNMNIPSTHQLIQNQHQSNVEPDRRETYKLYSNTQTFHNGQQLVQQYAAMRVWKKMF